jgi:hypothetical protein
MISVKDFVINFSGGFEGIDIDLLYNHIIRIATSKKLEPMFTRDEFWEFIVNQPNEYVEFVKDSETFNKKTKIYNYIIKISNVYLEIYSIHKPWLNMIN